VTISCDVAVSGRGRGGGGGAQQISLLAIFFRAVGGEVGLRFPTELPLSMLAFAIDSHV